MVDSFTNSGLVSGFTQASKYFTYFSNFMTDLIMFIFATFFMDAVLQMVHKYKRVAGEGEPDVDVEDFSAMTDFTPEL